MHLQRLALLIPTLAVTALGLPQTSAEPEEQPHDPLTEQAREMQDYVREHFGGPPQDREKALKNAAIAARRDHGQVSVPAAATTLELSMFYVMQGRPKEGEQVLRDNLLLAKVLELEPGPDIQPDLFNLMYTSNFMVAISRLQQNDLVAAKKHYTIMQQVARLGFPADSTKNAAATNGLAEVLMADGYFEEAAKKFRSALGAFQQVRGPLHNDALMTRLAYARAIRAQGKDAKPAYLEFGKYHHKAFKEGIGLAPGLAGVAFAETLIEAGGMYDVAEQFLRISCERDEVDVNNSEDQRLLAVTLREQGKYEEAEKWFATAGKSTARWMGKEHPHVARNEFEFAKSLAAWKKLDPALEHAREALRIQKKALRKGHPHTAETESLINAILKEQANSNID